MSASDEETITILKSEYKELLRCASKLTKLENGGVDNWEWYDEAMSAEDEGEDE